MEIPAPAEEGATDLQGITLEIGDRTLELLAWESEPSSFVLIDRPLVGFELPSPPEWLPDLRLLFGQSSTGFLVTPVTDGTLACAISKLRPPIIRLER